VDRSRGVGELGKLVTPISGSIFLMGVEVCAAPIVRCFGAVGCGNAL